MTMMMTSSDVVDPKLNAVQANGILEVRLETGGGGKKDHAEII